ncbi:hypothetical protein PP187_gp199 [Klebsiella phage vB_KvM-Eowyn]|uniref:Uncharacterized protein n=1 Tax=Klebsiella phage vB_KvM-Eowyn TaxID=2762819 RepID=A0A7R8MJK5_9CAUD|nr:hypothetical protein PP187_gp199 [Klebsiella phage vB_KvM-Eowyn]CAD5236188.1 hypothetical protein LLCLJKAH_00199 [Klebsiella phage vB_KvM-Eowyn]
MNKFIRVVAAGVAGHVVGSLTGAGVAIGVDAIASQTTNNPDKRTTAAMVGGTLTYWIAGVKTAIHVYKHFE